MNATALPEIPGFAVLQELAVGGMSSVYLALQRSLERKVALKVLFHDECDALTAKRFLLEGRTLAKLSHPNIVEIFDIVEAGNLSYISMPYLEGGNLLERLQAGLTVQDAVRVVVQLASALQYAHVHGVVHRDLKPANVLFQDTLTPILTDFGIARQQGADAPHLTQTGMMLGTPLYMSPEQIRGEALDGRTDQYSLGIVFHELLVGRPPFSGDSSFSLMMAHIEQTPPRLPERLGEFQPILDRMLAKSAQDRYPNLKAVLEDFRSLAIQPGGLLTKAIGGDQHSASESLRQLGFSDSQIYSPAATVQVSKRVASHEPGPTRSTSKPSAPMPVADPPKSVPAPSPSGSRRLVVGLVAVMVLLAAPLAWLVVARMDPLDAATRATLNAAEHRVDELIEAGKLFTPVGDNAFEVLRSLPETARQQPGAVERLTRLAHTVKRDAAEALQRGDLLVAQGRLDEAALIDATDPDLESLRSKIQTARLTIERERQIDELLVAADAALAQSRASGAADSALELIDQALRLDRNHAEAARRKQALIEGLLAAPRESLQRKRLSEAAKQLTALAPVIGDEPEWNRLNGELANARKRQLDEDRIAALLFGASRHLAAGRLTQPAGDNALELVNLLKRIDANHPEAQKLTSQISTRMSERGLRFERSGKHEDSLESYGQALRVDPNNSAARDGLARLQARLGGRDFQVLSLVGEARNAINEGRYVSPPGKNARESLDAALRLDPENAEAHKLRADLPRLVNDAAEALAAQGSREEALRMARDGAIAFPGRADLTNTLNRLEGQR